MPMIIILWPAESHTYVFILRVLQPITATRRAPLNQSGLIPELGLRLIPPKPQGCYKGGIG